MPAYPVRFSNDRFPRVPNPVLPVVPKSVKSTSKTSSEMGGTLRIGPTYAAVDALWIQDTGSSKQSISCDNHSDTAYADAADPLRLQPSADNSFRHFHFLPGIDPVAIHWKVTNIHNVSRLKFELWSAADDTAPVWTYERDGDSARSLLRGPKHKGDGSLAWDQVVVPVTAEHPQACPNAAHAPYQLRLTVTCSETRAVTTAWTHFDILVDAIELHWGPAAWIPAVPIPNVSPMLRARTTADELALLRRLKRQVQPSDPAFTPIPPDGTIEIRLPSTMAAYAHFNEWFGFGRDFAYLRHRARWGDGPRIPIKAVIYPKRMDGTRLDPASGGPTWDQAGAALGPVRLLWDWHDRSLRLRTIEENQRWDAAGAFVLRALNYKPNSGQEPPGCLNCHFERGGKRGAPGRIFPPQNGTGTLPFAVATATNRTWAALSTAKTRGADACTTGVLFHPSRMAKDTYRISVLLANQRPGTLAPPVVDVAGNIDDLLLAHPGLPTARTGMTEIVRQVNARYIRKRNYAAVNLSLVSQTYGVAGLFINWLNHSDPNFTGLWTEQDYRHYLAQAIAKAGNFFSDQQIMGRRYSGTQQNRVRQTRYGQIDVLLNRQLLPNYDHWFGTLSGVGGAQPSDVCFTLPSRAAVVSPFLDQAIQNYINKNRIFNNVRRAWNRFLQNNGGPPATPALRLQFYNTLAPNKKLKVDGIAATLYKAAGWQTYDQLNPNTWVLNNYGHMNGPIDLLAEMHQLKIADDAFEGVSFFHYHNILETVDAAGNRTPNNPVNGDPTGRYYGLSGVAKCDTAFDLGLKSVFFLWDHPTANYRGNNFNEVMMTGNTIAVHEFGHNLHLTHPFGSDGAWNRDMHDKNPPERPEAGQAAGPADRCVMNYHPQDTELCGACRLRLRGWAMFRVPPLEGFDVTDPSRPGLAIRRSGSPLYNAFFTDLD